MGTRAMVARQANPNGVYELYYRHLDGYPTCLGVDLIEALRSPLLKGWEDVAKECKLEDESKTVEKPEAAFLKVQGDLDYIYEVRDYDPKSLTIYKTSNPWDGAKGLPSFVFPIWFSYRHYFPAPHDTPARMAEVERTASIALQSIKCYHEALSRKEA